jgi:hypothetical protein
VVRRGTAYRGLVTSVLVARPPARGRRGRDGPPTPVPFTLCADIRLDTGGGTWQTLGKIGHRAHVTIGLTPFQHFVSHRVQLIGESFCAQHLPLHFSGTVWLHRNDQ